MEKARGSGRWGQGGSSLWVALVSWGVREATVATSRPRGQYVVPWCPVSSWHCLHRQLLPAAGVNTCDIITLYISAIKALRVLDPSMVILEVACEPIRRYLR